MSKHIQLIVGLGNPGKEYANTRHNVGIWCLQALCHAHATNFNLQNKLKASIATLTINNVKVRCAIPTVYMNESGLTLALLCNYYAIQPQNILVLHDELAFAPGDIRYKFDGGHNGHNGLRSIIAHIGANFLRMRIGIGHPGNKDQVSDYVLSEPNKNDTSLIINSIENILTTIDNVIKKGDINGI